MGTPVQTIKLIDYNIEEIGAKTEIRLARSSGTFFWKIPNKKDEYLDRDTLAALKEDIRRYYIRPDMDKEELYACLYIDNGTLRTAIRKIPNHSREKGNWHGYDVESWVLDAEQETGIRVEAFDPNFQRRDKPIYRHNLKYRWVKVTPHTASLLYAIDATKVLMAQAESISRCHGEGLTQVKAAIQSKDTVDAQYCFDLLQSLRGHLSMIEEPLEKARRLMQATADRHLESFTDSINNPGSENGKEDKEDKEGPKAAQ